ncbi:MAG: alpha/beta fold hydrolase [Oligoflexus sp.]
MSKNNCIQLEFTEEMHGYFSVMDQVMNHSVESVDSYVQAAEAGKSAQQTLRFRLTITILDFQAFLQDPMLQAKAEGYVEAPVLGGQLQVIDGRFNLFVPAHDSFDSEVIKEMHYCLYLKDQDERDITLYGFKAIHRGNIESLWQETTTLYCRIWKGHYSQPAPERHLIGRGVLRLTAADFAKQMSTFRAHGGDCLSQQKAVFQFMELFAGNLWDAYRPQFSLLAEKPHRSIPINTLSGVSQVKKTTHTFSSYDGLGLSLTRFFRQPSSQPILLIHGLTSSSDMFIMPEHYNLVQFLLDHGYGDIWCLDWRGSRRFYYNLEPHKFSVDDVALYDIPAAMDHLRLLIGNPSPVNVICHCVGSIAFMMSMAAGKLNGIASVISNSVSLTPKVSPWSRWKLRLAPNLVDYVLRLPYISPQMAENSILSPGGWLARLVSLFHRECHEKPCHMVSFMWGAGHPAAFQHENLSPLTHERLADLFGGTSMHYYRHIAKMVRNGVAVPFDEQLAEKEGLPQNYLHELAANIDSPVLLVSGKENHIFPGSNQMTAESLLKLNPRAPVSYLEVPGYGHQDIFMGRSADQDVFPRILNFYSSLKGVKAA